MKVKIVLVILSVFWPNIALSENIYEDFPESQYMNLSVDPCEDFYEYTCGNFKNLHPLSNDELTIDHFTLLEEELTKLASRIRVGAVVLAGDKINILSETNAGDDPQALNKTKSAYKACIDLKYLKAVKNPEVTIVKEERGFPLVQSKYLQEVTKYGLLDVAVAASKYGIPMLFNIAAYPNIVNASSNLIYIYPLETGSLTPTQIRPKHETSYEELIEKAFSTISEQEENVKSMKSDIVLKPFDIFLRKMALKIRNAVQSIVTDNEVYKNIEVMTNFTRIAFTGGIIDNTAIVEIEGNSVVSTTVKQLNDWTKAQFTDTLKLDWVEFLQRSFANSGIEITEDTEVMKYVGLENLLYGILNLIRLSKDHVVKSFVMMRIFTHLSPESDFESRNFIEEYFTSMNVKILPRWKYCTRKLIDSAGTAGLSFATAYEYQLRHFNVNRYINAVRLIEDLQDSFKDILKNVSWMDPASKENATKKFDNMLTILGHPDVSYDKESLDKFYENLRICKWDNYGNSIRIKAFKNAYQISQVAKRERPFWEKSPFEVNAYYNRPNNKMIFPISMLHPIFFGNNNSILDYGRIGSIIGHEMTHGFDSDGMKYGADGTTEPWATQETKAAFANRTDCFVDEYNHFYEPELQRYVNGSITLNENIADNGGLREAYWAMKKLLKRNKNLTGTKNFTPEQLFFIGYGTLWCNNPSVEYLTKMQTNVHCRSKFRVNGVVSNMEEFAQAFSCPIGSSMNPSNKCNLW